MKANAPNRREFLYSTGFVAAGLATSGSVIFALVMARQLFPHDRLGDQYYAAVIDAVDKQAASDPALRKLLAEGVAQLDGARGIRWVELSSGARSAVLKMAETSEFFSTMRTATINHLYGNPLVCRFFGFEGSSVEYGGYINRGFDDIGWLPNS
jgi:hypothetical protein